MGRDCLFCAIASGQTSTPLVYSDQDLAAFADIHPAAPVHLLLVPKRHIRSIADLRAGDLPLIGRLISSAKTLAEQQGIADSGYRLMFNVRGHGGQVIEHLHLHLLGGKQLGRIA